MENLSLFLNEFFAVLTITVLVVISPGADFIVTIKNSLSGSRLSGIYTAIGISTAIWIHTFYTLIGIEIIISQSILFFTIIKIIGTIYLIFLGISSIRNNDKLKNISARNMILSNWKSFQSGFFTNLFNPKATIFYVSVFTQIVSTKTPIYIKLLYGLTISLVCFVWFSIVAIFLNHDKIQSEFLKIQKPIEITLGIILIGFGLKVGLMQIG